MKRQSLRIIVILAAISLVGIVTTQIFWVTKAFTLEEKKFNESVHTALFNVAQEILDVNEDPTELTDPVHQISSNYFVVTVNDTLHPYLLQSMLSREFKRRNINIDYEYVIYDCFTDSLVFGDYVTVEDQEKDMLQSISRDDYWNSDGHYFGIYFPSKGTYIVSHLDAWIYSSVIILFVIFFFTYSISTILKQKRLSEIKNDFINNMTHEFKTPISTIQLSSDVLMEEGISNEPERLKTYAKIISDENKRLKRQVDKVLQLASLNSSETVLERKDIDLHELVAKSMKSFEPLLATNNGKITTTLDAKNSIVTGDEMHLGNVVHNLIDNGIKYSKESAVINIRTRNQGRKLIIEVQDHGIGIDPKNHKQVFEKFYRVPTGDIHNVKGFGLGLFYVKSIVESHNGKISMNSKPGEGTTFTIELNCKNE